MDGLVGYTGFVGGNLTRQHRFSGLFNSKNIDLIHDHNYDLLVISAVPATMWLANENPEADRNNILELFNKLSRVRASRVVLISTIAVYKNPSQVVDETSQQIETNLPYGRHRYEFEQLISDTFSDHLILRLPALFGQDLKKNFLFDLMNPVPSFLKPATFEQLIADLDDPDRLLVEKAFRWKQAAGMWEYNRLDFKSTPAENQLERICSSACISSRAFTHADSMFQFYDLSRLWKDMGKALETGIKTLNLATQPLRAGDIHKALIGTEMTYRDAPIIRQNMRSRFSELWGRKDGYLIGQDEILSGIRHLTGLPR